VVRYHFLCVAHRRVGSAPIHERVAPRIGGCPVCREQLEVWVGTHTPHGSADAHDTVINLRRTG
jgi:hypothetical protein